MVMSILAAVFCIALITSASVGLAFDNNEWYCYDPWVYYYDKEPCARVNCYVFCSSVSDNGLYGLLRVVGARLFRTRADFVARVDLDWSKRLCRK